MREDRLYEMPVAEIARTLGVSRQRVYQIEAKALSKIREGLAARGYGAEFVDMPPWLIECILVLALSD